MTISTPTEQFITTLYPDAVFVVEITYERQCGRLKTTKITASAVRELFERLEKAAQRIYNSKITAYDSCGNTVATLTFI